jgi:hypothetical protein
MRFLLDEQLSERYQQQLLRQNPDLTVRSVGGTDAPPRGTLDPALLVWCEENNFLLVTNNRRSMPGHLRDHLDAGRHVPGILAIRRRAGIGDVMASLLLIAGVSLPDEFRDRIEYIPLQR